MNDPSIVFYLAIFTLVAAAAFGFFQARRAQKAKEERKDSTFADRRIPPKSAS